MAMLTKPSAAAKMALAYITIGALMIVWTGVWFAYLYQHQDPPPHPSTYYLCTALMLTGITLLVIGLGLGRIGRAARKAELPPPEAAPTVAHTDQIAARTGAPTPENAPAAPPAQAAPAPPAQAIPVTPPVTAGTPYSPGR
jgi:hypothetical protein